MTFNGWDLFVIVLYFAISIGAGLYGSRNKSSLKEFFVAGGRIPFWLAGTGMVATTFAADTPLAVAGIVGTSGIAGNWIWWCSAAGGMLTVFFFARLWRRSGLTTDLELIEFRYSGKPAAVLRGSKAIYFGFFINCIILGWVNLAMVKIFEGMVPGYDARILVTITACITTAYVAASGLWGVAISDVFQFVIAMIGCIVLAIVAVNSPTIRDAGGIANILPPEAYDFFPKITSSADSATAMAAGPMNGAPVYSIPLVSFLAFICVQWWASWYPGAEPGGGGYIAQRILSAKDEKNGMLATLWFVIAHYAVRPWPWIIAGLAAIVIYPQLAPDQKESGYVYLMRDLLPSPLRGLLLAAFLGAYMSTLSTHLHWGSSYLINDFYKRFLVKDAEEKKYVLAARITTVILLVTSLFTTFYLLDTISGAWKLLLEFGAGTGFVLILRWYYWRINAFSEITAMVTPAILVLILHFVKLGIGNTTAESLAILNFPGSLFLIVSVTIVCTLIVTFLTKPEPDSLLKTFFDRIEPAGPGFARYGKSSHSLLPSFAGWISGTALTYCLLFLGGAILLGASKAAFLYGTGAIASTAILVLAIRKNA